MGMSQYLQQQKKRDNNSQQQHHILFWAVFKHRFELAYDLIVNY